MLHLCEELSREAYIMIAHKRGMLILATQLLINCAKADHLALLSTCLAFVVVPFCNEALDCCR